MIMDSADEISQCAYNFVDFINNVRDWIAKLTGSDDIEIRREVSMSLKQAILCISNSLTSLNSDWILTECSYFLLDRPSEDAIVVVNILDAIRNISSLHYSDRVLEVIVNYLQDDRFNPSILSMCFMILSRSFEDLSASDALLYEDLMENVDLFVVSLNIVFVNSLDACLLSCAWHCVYTILSAESVAKDFRFSKRWDFMLCITSALEAESYVLLIQRLLPHEAESPCFWLMPCIRLIARRGKEAELYGVDLAEYNNWRDFVTIKLMDLLLDHNWGFSISTEKSIFTTPTVEQELLFCSAIDVLLTLENQNDNEEAGFPFVVVNYILGDQDGVIIIKYLTLLEECLLRNNFVSLKYLVRIIFIIMQLYQLNSVEVRMYSAIGNPSFLNGINLLGQLLPEILVDNVADNQNIRVYKDFLLLFCEEIVACCLRYEPHVYPFLDTLIPISTSINSRDKLVPKLLGIIEELEKREVNHENK